MPVPTPPSARFDPGEPYARDQLLAAMAALTNDAERYLSAIPAPEFAAAQGDRWSPADHVRHLAKSAFAIGTGVGLPRIVLWLRFGPSRAPSRTFVRLRDDYRAALAAGGQAGKFAPESRALPADLGGYQRQVIAKWRAANEALRTKAATWRDAALDGARITHPLIGPLTVREMLMFAHYHESHHLNLLAVRRPATPAPGA